MKDHNFNIHSKWILLVTTNSCIRESKHIKRMESYPNDPLSLSLSYLLKAEKQQQNETFVEEERRHMQKLFLNE